jgi:hypothetical protein
MGIEYYFICEDHKEKIFISKHHPSADLFHLENLELFLTEHMGCSLTFLDDNAISNRQFPMPFRESMDSPEYLAKCEVFKLIGDPG